MIDAVGRNVNHLRMSLTNRCNLNCFYCHHEGDESDFEMSKATAMKILTDARECGIRTVKFTGGEPLLRQDLCEIIAHANHLGFDIGLTTNGTLLKERLDELKCAGLKRINIGCDSVDLSLSKNLPRLKRTIQQAAKLFEIKLNMVVMKQNKNHIMEMLDFARLEGVNLQLIELIKCPSYDEEFVDLQQIEDELSKNADRTTKRRMQARRRFWFGDIFVETVKPGKEFCQKCNKLRITADGKLKSCLKRPNKLKYTGLDSLQNAIIRRDSYGYS